MEDISFVDNWFTNFTSSQVRLAFVVLLCASILLISKNKIACLVVSILSLLVYLTHSMATLDDPQFMIKGFLIYIASIYYFSLYFVKFNFDIQIGRFFLFINVLVIGIYEIFYSNQSNRLVPGILLVLICFLIPKFIRETKKYTTQTTDIYLANYGWVIIYSMALLTSYVYTNCFTTYREKYTHSQFSTITAILVPIALSAFNPKKYITYRALALCIDIAIVDLLPELRSKMMINTKPLDKYEIQTTAFNALLVVAYVLTHLDGITRNIAQSIATLINYTPIKFSH